MWYELYNAILFSPQNIASGDYSNQLHIVVCLSLVNQQFLEESCVVIFHMVLKYSYNILFPKYMNTKISV